MYVSLKRTSKWQAHSLLGLGSSTRTAVEANCEGVSTIPPLLKALLELASSWVIEEVLLNTFIKQSRALVIYRSIQYQVSAASSKCPATILAFNAV